MQEFTERYFKFFPQHKKLSANEYLQEKSMTLNEQVQQVSSFKPDTSKTFLPITHNGIQFTDAHRNFSNEINVPYSQSKQLDAFQSIASLLDANTSLQTSISSIKDSIAHEKEREAQLNKELQMQASKIKRLTEENQKLKVQNNKNNSILNQRPLSNLYPSQKPINKQTLNQNYRSTADIITKPASKIGNKVISRANKPLRTASTNTKTSLDLQKYSQERIARNNQIEFIIAQSMQQMNYQKGLANRTVKGEELSKTCNLQDMKQNILKEHFNAKIKGINNPENSRRRTTIQCRAGKPQRPIPKYVINIKTNQHRQRK